jgi:hypothetical protein
MPIRARYVAIFCKHEAACTIGVLDSKRTYYVVDSNQIFPGVFHRGVGQWRYMVTFALFREIIDK